MTFYSAVDSMADEVRRQYSSRHHDVYHDLGHMDDAVVWSSSDRSDQSDQSDQSTGESDLIYGDEEDDGMFIGAPHHDDDESIAFSDIVLPTGEDQDPFLVELNAQMAAEAAILADDPPMPSLIPSVDHVPTKTPTEAPTMGYYRHKQVKAPVKVKDSPSAHTTVAHAMAKKREELENLSPAELLERLEKRLRPYMKMSLKLPPLRRRVRPNCLFLNYMGTRRPPAPKKRKLAAADLATKEGVAKKKKEGSPLLVDPVTATTTASQKPTTVTAPSSPRRVEKPVSVLPPSKPDAPAVLPKLLTDPLWEKDLVQKKPDKPQPPTPLKPPAISKPLHQGQSEGTDGKESTVTTNSEKLSSAVSIDEDKPKAKSCHPVTKRALIQKKLDEVTRRFSGAKPTHTGGAKKVIIARKELDDAKRAEVFKTPRDQRFSRAMPKHAGTKKVLSQKELDDAKRSEVFKSMAASMSPNPMALIPTKADPPGKPSIVSRQMSGAFKSSSSRSDLQEAEEVHEPLDPFSEHVFRYDPSHHHDVLSSLATGHEGRAHSPPVHYLEADDVHDSISVSPLQVGSDGARVLGHEDYVPFEQDDDHYHPNVTCHESDLSDDSSSSSLLPSRKQKTPPTPSFATIRRNADLPHRAQNRPHFTTRSPRPRPMLLSPEMDMLASGARYAYHGPSQGTMENHMPPSSPQVAPKRALPVRMITKMSSRGTKEYYATSTSHAQDSDRRSSLPYPPLPTDNWTPTLHSAGETALVTPDDKVKHVMEPAVKGTSQYGSIPCPPFVSALHPHDGYHSPVSRRRVINDLALHNKGVKSDESQRRSGGKPSAKTMPRLQLSKETKKHQQKATMKTKKCLPVKKTKTISPSRA